jgi:Ca2+-binding RTX toxin-like protein
MRARIAFVVVLTLAALLPSTRAGAASCSFTLFGGAAYITGTSSGEEIFLRQVTTAEPDMVQCRSGDSGPFGDVAPINAISRIDVNLGDGIDSLHLGDESFPTEDLGLPTFADGVEFLFIDAATSGVQHQITMNTEQVIWSASGRVFFTGLVSTVISLGSNNDNVVLSMPLTSVVNILPGGGVNTMFIDGTNGGDTIEIGPSTIKFNDVEPISYSDISLITVSAGEGNDRVRGGPDADLLAGDAGNDRISGAGGADQLEGGPGTDGCSGGPGKDTFKGCETKKQ